jgi:ABC-type multidrug transport system fused ATPase/permease subunit
LTGGQAILPAGMTETNSDMPAADQACANCGAALNGDFCADCGQSRDALKRPIIGLFTEALDGIFTWDGRLLTTFRQLFLRPGRVAREFVDGRRRSYTPPIRLYLIVSLVFFAAMAISGIRIVAVNITADEAGEAGLFITLFQPPRDGAPVILSEEMQQQVLTQAEDNNISSQIQELVLLAMNNPDVVEERAAAAASQAMILMVFVFALLSAVLHPRRRLIEHAVHALYFHAALLLPFAAIIISGIYLPLPLWAGIGLAVATVLLMAGMILFFERGFYDSSWIGAALRLFPVLLGYLSGAVCVALGLILFTAL